MQCHHCGNRFNIPDPKSAVTTGATLATEISRAASSTPITDEEPIASVPKETSRADGLHIDLDSVKRTSELNKHKKAILISGGILILLVGYLIYQSQPDVVPFSEVDAAMLKIRQIEAAVNAYHRDHNRYPESLLVLYLRSEIEKGPYLKDEISIIDPWGQGFGYDPNGVDPETGQNRPRIFSQHPKYPHVKNY